MAGRDRHRKTPHKESEMKAIPETATAVVLKNGSVYTPIWPHAEREGWYVGTLVTRADGVAPGELLAGGNYSFPPVRVARALTPNEFEILKLQLLARTNEQTQETGQ